MNKILYFLVVVFIVIFMSIGLSPPTPVPPNPIPPSPSPNPIPPTPVPGSQVVWVNFPKQREQNAGTPFLTDIVSHLPVKYGNYYFDNDRITWGHETTHGINAHVRNTLANSREVGFYIGNNKAVLVQQPKITLTQIGNLVPKNLRGNRFQLYFVSQAGQWNNTPLYCFDEWVSYNNGAAVGLELQTRTMSERVALANSDVMIVALEFSIYAMFVGVAADRYDPDFLKTNGQFREFLAAELRRSIEIYRKGMLMPQYQWESALEKNVMQNQDCINILKKLYGNSLTMEMLFSNGKNKQNDLHTWFLILPNRGSSWGWSDRYTYSFDVGNYSRENRLIRSY